MKSINGKPVSEKQIDAWVEEAEQGYSLDRLRKRGRPTRGTEASQVIPLRLTQQELAQLDAYAEDHHMNRSQAIRYALSKMVSL